MTRADELVAAAREAALSAYAPYSGFRVGAAVLAEDGTVFTGANVENASYPVSSCAEATAVAHAASKGMRRIIATAVACIDADSIEGAYPCGRCRQILSEFDTEDVYVTTATGEVRTHTLDELLPHGFKL
ncbi:MAG TPA: cytidine deaminase [Acidimicrobiia bacterium]|nr:cytidine deaminase [Acidimicrobiia bacterium]